MSDKTMGPKIIREESALTVTGRVKRPFMLPFSELCRMEAREVEDLQIICGSGDPKGRIAHCRGVVLEDVIRRAEVITEEDNDTKRMFVVVTAGDGYKVVFSWQEIFNTPIGDGVILLIEKNGIPLRGGHDRLDLVSSEDYFTGSRYVKGVEKIEITLAA